MILAAGAVYLLGQYFRGYWLPNFTWPFRCYMVQYQGTTYCDPQYLGTLGWPLITAGEVLAIVGVILLFANARALRGWWRMSCWYVPAAVLLVIFLPYQSPLNFMSGSPDYNLTVQLWGGLYIIITLGIVLWDFFASPRHL